MAISVCPLDYNNSNFSHMQNTHFLPRRPPKSHSLTASKSQILSSKSGPGANEDLWTKQISYLCTILNIWDRQRITLINWGKQKRQWEACRSHWPTAILNSHKAHNSSFSLGLKAKSWFFMVLLSLHSGPLFLLFQLFVFMSGNVACVCSWVILSVCFLYVKWLGIQILVFILLSLFLSDQAGRVSVFVIFLKCLLVSFH